MKLIDNNEKRRQKDDGEIKELKDLLDEERRKSMLDQGKIRELEGVLAQRIKQANDASKKMQ